MTIYEMTISKPVLLGLALPILNDDLNCLQVNCHSVRKLGLKRLVPFFLFASLLFYSPSPSFYLLSFFLFTCLSIYGSIFIYLFQLPYFSPPLLLFQCCFIFLFFLSFFLSFSLYFSFSMHIF